MQTEEGQENGEEEVKEDDVIVEQETAKDEEEEKEEAKEEEKEGEKTEQKAETAEIQPPGLGGGMPNIVYLNPDQMETQIIDHDMYIYRLDSKSDSQLVVRETRHPVESLDLSVEVDEENMPEQAELVSDDEEDQNKQAFKEYWGSGLDTAGEENQGARKI